MSRNLMGLHGLLQEWLNFRLECDNSKIEALMFVSSFGI
jgi:hypothetical protein